MMKETVMLYQVLFLCLFIVVDARSVEKVSENNVTKRAANSDFFPDWVPFKNKKGEQLGEFEQVETKKKPKKRLAQPLNYKLKSVAPQSDYDDFGGGGGETEGEDFEKKEWSDLYRQGAKVKPSQVSHADLSDIDGVVNIITQPIFYKSHETDILTTTMKPEVTTTVDDDDYLDQSKEKREGKEAKDEQYSKNKQEEKKTTEPKRTSEEDYTYEDDKKQKEKQAQVEMERKESEARKALILNAVDELKARHQMQQSLLSEKEKEDEIFKEEHERDRIDSEEGRDKYDRKKPKFSNYYEVYDDNLGSTSYDKYDIIVERTTPLPTTTISNIRKKTKKRKHKTKKPAETENLTAYNNNNIEKISVFKNPEAFIIFNNKEEPSSTISTFEKKVIPKRTTKHPKDRKIGKFSAKYSLTPNSPPSLKSREDSVRISLVPEASDSDESPTLFFPHTKSKRKKKRGKNSTTNPDSSEVKTVAEPTAKNSIHFPFNFDMRIENSSTIDDTTGSDTTTIDITSPAGTEADAISSDSNTVTVPDVKAASTDTKQEKKQGGNYAHKKGGDREYSASHEEVHGEHGKKAYEGKHEHTKQAKGHHDKEDHSGEYVDKAGTDKKHHDESNHYGDHHHEEHGKKHAKYEESGKHSKGHSTKGSHDIHKKEEYEKRVEFFEEDGDSSEEEKHGGYNHERDHSSGGKFKKANLEASHSGHDKGDTNHKIRGGHSQGHKGHKVAEGQDGHGRHHQAHFQESGKKNGKRWGHSYSAPGKIARLNTIDRRVDQFYNGPQYYG